MSRPSRNRSGPVLASAFVLLLVLAALWAAMPSGAEEPGHEGFHNRSTTFYIHAVGGQDAASCQASLKENHTGITTSTPVPYLSNVVVDPCHQDPTNTENLRVTMSPIGDSKIVVYLMPALSENVSLSEGTHIKGRAVFEVSGLSNSLVPSFDHFDINVSLDADTTSMGFTGSSIDGVDPVRITDTLSADSFTREVEFDLGPAPAEMPEGPATLTFAMVNKVNPPDPDRLGGTITLLTDADNKGTLEIPFKDGPKVAEPEPEPEPTNTTVALTPEPTATVNDTATPTPTPTPTVNNTTTPEDVGDDKALPAPGFLVILATAALLVAVAQRRRGPA